MAASWWALFRVSLVLACWAVGSCRRLWALRACVVSAWTIADSAIQQRHALASTLLDALREPPRVDPRLLETALSAACSAFKAAVDRCNRAVAEAPTRVLARLFGFEPAARWWGTLR
jgi:hypothetical protein